MRSPSLSGLVLAALIAAAPLAATAMVVPIDHAKKISVSGSAASVVVGNPTVADVTVVDSHTIYVMGRGYGSTDISVLDHGGRTLYAGEVTVAAAGASVSVYRGVEQVTYACDHGCSEYSSHPTPQASFGQSPSATGGAGPAAALAAVAAATPPGRP